MIDSERPALRDPRTSGRPSGGAGHVFTLYFGSQDPSPPSDGLAPGEPLPPLGFLRSDEEGPPGP